MFVKSRCIGTGRHCPKCHKLMGRFEHPDHWKPRPTQPYYFTYWDKCTKCRHIQHYEDAKCYLSGDKPETDWTTSFEG